MIFKYTKYAKVVAFLLVASLVTGCASIINDRQVPISMSFSDGSDGECLVRNKRGALTADFPSVVNVNRSDDILAYDCTLEDGRDVKGGVPSQFGAMFWGNLVFGGVIGMVIDATTDKHRNYPASYVMPTPSK